MVKVTQNSFLGGQLDFEMMGRQDFQKYQKGASVLKNFNVLKRGGITKRQGFDRLFSVYNYNGTAEDEGENDANPLCIDEGPYRLVPFAYDKEHGFVLVFSQTECLAVCTVKGRGYRAWHVNPPAGHFSAEELPKFTYVQCGYKLFLASDVRRPAVIKTTYSDVEAALADDSAPSPFVWEEVDFSASQTGVPSILSFEQTRTAPTEDNCGGIVTEQYRVSAVFDDVETRACEAAYDTTRIEPVALDSANKTLVQQSESAAYVTVQKDASDQTTGTTEVPAQTASVYTNKVMATCGGTSYYAPWVDSQVIRINVKVVPKKVNGVDTWPEQIRVYKKSFGYFGLIGTASLLSDANVRSVDAAAAGSGTFGPVTANKYELLVGDDVLVRSTARKYAEQTEAVIAFADDSSIDASKLRTQFSATGAGVMLSPNSGGKFKDGVKVRLFLGKLTREFGNWHETNGNTWYNRPQSCTWKYVQNRCSSVDVTVAYSYNSGSGTATGTTTKTISISGLAPTIGSLANWKAEMGYTDSPYGNAVFALNALAGGDIGATYSLTLSSGVSSGVAITRQRQFRNNVADVEKYVIGKITANPRYADITIDTTTFTDLANKDDLSITGVTIAPTAAAGENPALVVSGVGVSGKAYVGTYTFDDDNITPDTSITPLEDDEPLFQGEGNYPACVALVQQRLVWASTKKNPETVWMSAVGDFSQYTAHSVTTQEDAIEFALPVTRFAKLNHMVEMRQLLAFNDACEWLIDSSSTTAGLSAETIQARPQSYSGCSGWLRPIVCNNAVVFCERTGQAVRRFSYQIENDGFAGRDVSILSSSIFERNRIVDWTYQQHPFSTVWCVLADGTMASLTMMDEQDIMAWAVHKHGGNTRVLNICTSYAVSPSLDEVTDGSGESYENATHEEIFALVADDTSKRVWLERMRVRSRPSDTIYNSLCLDSVRVCLYSDEYTANDSPDGLQQACEGRIWVNGSTGQVTNSPTVAGTWLPTKAQYDEQQSQTDPPKPMRVFEGYTYEAKLTTVYPLVGNTVGVGQFDIKDITNVGLRLEWSAGGEVATAHYESEGRREKIRYDDDRDNNKSMVITPDDVPNDGGVALHNCDCANVKPYGYNCRDGRVTVMQSEPWPFTILSIETDYATENEGGGNG